MSFRVGSSPHTWGIRLPDLPRRWLPRFIPTYVGHTSFSGPVTPESPVHPHIRGAYLFGPDFQTLLVGSSPHTWGILVHLSGPGEKLRFIPTYVGHTATSRTLLANFSVHPHIRGAYVRGGRGGNNIFGSSPHTWGIRYFSFIRSLVGSGSSPHTWGILKTKRMIQNENRFIPTYVGHTWPLTLRRGKKPVHPHIRGAYNFKVCL